EASVPMDTIERAIKRGTGELEGVRYEAVSYEGYAPAGVAVIVECLTDNRNRTGAEVRTIFTRGGGSMAEPGAVSWQFERKGVVLLPRSVDEETLTLVAVDAGAEDLTDDGDTWRVTCAPTDLARVRAGLEEAGLAVESAELAMVSTTSVPLGEEDARKVLRVMDALEDHDDVQSVWSNFDIPDAVLEAVEA
ncbi:MAG: YebC/PmpR family DNA-binding transcriptional regulator, partial [Acidimicrobiales bacterium]